ncbi:MAG: ATP synthase F0 subunit C [Acholeplasmataceae bacterium]|jgi:F-type H+-transporting ATPase subunit c|nr:ATP synthase F0 subunit C [Acholeplasmataceae bacterium]
MLQTLLEFIPRILEVVPNEFYRSGLAYIGAGIAVFTGFGTAIGQGIAASKGVEAVGRQPEASGKITVTMLIGQAVAETTGIYGLIIAFILTSK